MFSDAPKSICILRLSAIGDVCNAIAAVQAIQSYWPETQITWITGKLEAQLLDSVKGIRVIVFDKKSGFNAYTSVWKQLEEETFDALLHMQYAIRASVVSLGIKATYTLGFSADRSQDFQTLFTNVKVPSPKSNHVADGFMAFAYKLGVKDMVPNWTLEYSEADKHWARSKMHNKKPNLLLVPGASKAYKNWNAAGYVSVINHARNNGWHVILAGSPSQVEVELANDIQSILEKPCESLVSRSSLLQMLALIDNADLVIAPDTGPVHMANAMSTPVIGLYAHHNPKRVGPYRYLKYTVSVYEEAVFSETGKTPQQLNWRTRVKDSNAMSLISSVSVISMFDAVSKDLSLQLENERI
ncbi:glycosyltransferase family 9 protein [Grimontia sp. S25]|uniref:Glycosyltransferase family 9 protein n=1 Tax=Grimontia sedimenti TaxID=2711294 RepID=A0A6M1RIA4_9GAMM|nr:glycosyltransferase family 9 protein [Grimontia sedimenti]NGN99182.1 glycosyltransferase family 9 protein [Grimontia sedimenti]